MSPAKDFRRPLIAKIKIAQKELALDDNTYRAVLLRVTGKDSCTKLSVPELERVLADLKLHGFKPKSSHAGQRPLRRVQAGPLMRKVEALLADGGLHWNYAHAMARRMFGRDKVEFLDNEQLRKLVAALQIAANRKKDKGAGNV